jgi:hypothetical protein
MSVSRQQIVHFDSHSLLNKILNDYVRTRYKNPDDYKLFRTVVLADELLSASDLVDHMLFCINKYYVHDLFNQLWIIKANTPQNLANPFAAASIEIKERINQLESSLRYQLMNTPWLQSILSNLFNNYGIDVGFCINSFLHKNGIENVLILPLGNLHTSYLTSSDYVNFSRACRRINELLRSPNLVALAKKQYAVEMLWKKAEYYVDIDDVISSKFTALRDDFLTELNGLSYWERYCTHEKKVVAMDILAILSLLLSFVYMVSLLYRQHYELKQLFSQASEPYSADNTQSCAELYRVRAGYYRCRSEFFIDACKAICQALEVKDGEVLGEMLVLLVSGCVSAFAGGTGSNYRAYHTPDNRIARLSRRSLQASSSSIKEKLSALDNVLRNITEFKNITIDKNTMGDVLEAITNAGIRLQSERAAEEIAYPLLIEMIAQLKERRTKADSFHIEILEDDPEVLEDTRVPVLSNNIYSFYSSGVINRNNRDQVRALDDDSDDEKIPLIPLSMTRSHQA